jgi:hypothetical protein
MDSANCITRIYKALTMQAKPQRGKYTFYSRHIIFIFLTRQFFINENNKISTES